MSKMALNRPVVGAGAPAGADLGGLGAGHGGHGRACRAACTSADLVYIERSASQLRAATADGAITIQDPRIVAHRYNGLFLKANAGAGVVVVPPTEAVLFSMSVANWPETGFPTAAVTSGQLFIRDESGWVVRSIDAFTTTTEVTYKLAIALWSE